MISIPKSGYFLPNRFALIFLQAMEDVLGVNGVKAILHIADLGQWIDNHPADNLEREVDFAAFSSINASLEEIYGARSGRNLARRSAWSMFDRALRHVGGITSVVDLAVKVLPTHVAMRQGLKGIALAFSRVSDQLASVEDLGDIYTFTFHRCATCWGRSADEPICYASIGLLEEALRWMSNGKSFRIQEVQCAAMGDEACVFHIDKKPMD
ncbi:MAG: 4-vinyl reductase [Anaerolineales bacterium]